MTRSARHGDSTAVRFDDDLCDRETEPSADVRVVSVVSDKIENPFQVGVGDSGCSAGHLEDDDVATARRSEAYAPARRGKPNGVLAQVLEHLTQPLGVGKYVREAGVAEQL